MAYRIVSYLFILLFLTACSRMDLYLAEKSYREALSTQMSKPIIASLKTLTLLDPGKYQEKLSSAEKAITELQKAKYYMVESNFYLAYLVSHKSYRTLPTKESKIHLSIAD